MAGLWGALRSAAELFIAKRATTNDRYAVTTVSAADVASNGYRKVENEQILARVRQHVLHCAMFNTNACASQPLRLYRRTSAIGRKNWAPHAKPMTGAARTKAMRNFVGKVANYAESDFEEVLDAPPLDLLRNANPTRRGTSFFKDCWMQTWIFGKRFVYHVDENRGAPSELWVMRGQDVGIIPHPSGIIGGFRYGRPGIVAQEFSTDEVMYHIAFPSPFNPYDALSPVHKIMVEADIYAASTISEKAMWENGARPDYLLSFKQSLTPEQRKQAEENINARMRGPNKRGNFLVTSDAQVVPLNFTQKEMEYLKGREDIKTDIYNAYGIPEPMRKMNSSNLASSQTALEQYARYTIWPALCEDAQEWSETLLPLFGVEPGEYWFAYDNPIPEDAERMRSDVVAYVRERVWTRNEARQMLGMDPIEGLDDMEQEQAPEDTTEDAEEQPEESEDIDEGDNGEDDEPGTKHTGKCCSHTKATATEPQRTAEQTPEERAIAERVYDAVLPWLNLIGAAIVLRELVGDAPENAVVVGSVVASLPASASTMPSPVNIALRDAARLGAATVKERAVLRLVGGESEAGPTRVTLEAALNTVNEWAPQFIDDYVPKLAGNVSDTTIDNIRQSIKRGIANGESLPQITARVQKDFAEASPARARAIAVTETRRAYVQGSLQLWKESGYTRKVLVLADNPCPICVAIADRVNPDGVPIDDTMWAKGEALRTGDGVSVTNTYMDADAPPFHPNCFCDLLPIWEDGGEA